MSSHNLPYELAGSPFEMLDPGTGKAIPIDRWGLTVGFVVGAGAETNTVAAPLKPFQFLSLFTISAGGGTRTVTFASAINKAGATTIAFNAVDDWAMLVSVPVGSGVYEWRVAATDAAPLTQQAHVADPTAPAALTATLTGVDTGTDMTAAQAATIVADFLALRTAIISTNAAVAAINVRLEVAGLVATS